METTIKLKRSSGNVFRKLVGKPNFMTPDLIGYYKIKNGEAELTKGSFMSNVLYGVTVVQDNRKNDDLSKCCHSMDEALEYINILQ